jgi:hypothetical protein
LAIAAQSLHPPRPRHAHPATRKRSANAPSPPPASAAASQPPWLWTRILWLSTRVPFLLENAQRPSCTSGSVVRSSTPPWVPTWWSNCTAKATPASPRLGRGRSSDGPTAVIGWPTNASAALHAALPIAPTARAGRSNPRSKRWRPMPADLQRLTLLDREYWGPPRRCGSWVAGARSKVSILFRPGCSTWLRSPLLVTVPRCSCRCRPVS